MLEAAATAMPGREEKAIKVNEVFGTQTQRGYLSEEVTQLIKILSARGLVAGGRASGCFLSLPSKVGNQPC